MQFETALAQLLKAITSDSGRVISKRKNINWLVENGYAECIRTIMGHAECILGKTDHDFFTILSIIESGNLILPACIVCNAHHTSWNKQQKHWSKYCSMKCCQADPAVKEKVVAGLAQVDWKETITRREKTMQERYGVIAASQLQENKIATAIRSKELWMDRERVDAAIEKRKQTNLERYGVEYLAQDKEFHAEVTKKANYTRSLKSEQDMLARIQKYRKTRMGADAFECVSSFDWMNQKYNVEQSRIGQIANLLEISYDAVKYAIFSHGFEFDSEREKVNRSVEEIELFEFIKTLVGDVQHSVRVDRKEMDIYIDDRKIGIEFNGVYWHSEKVVDKNYHKNKVEHFTLRGYKLYQIWEDDWNYRQHAVKTFLTNLLVKTSRIGANKTEVVLLSQNDFNTFLDDNHLLSGRKCSIRYGLVHEGEVKAVMGFNKIPSNEQYAGGYSLDRFANTNINGAFGKLLTHFERTHTPTVVRTFVDLQISNEFDNVYLKNGFVFDKKMNPDYTYYNPKTGVREDKRSWRNDVLIKNGAVGDCEHERALSLGLVRCYDSGKIRYVKKY